MSVRRKRPEEKKEVWAEQKRTFSFSSVDSKFGPTEDDYNTTFRKVEADNKVKLNENHSGFSKESFLQMDEGERILSTSKIKADVSKEAIKERNQQSRVKAKSQRKDSAIDYVCWKSPNDDEEEICYPSSSIPVSNANVKGKKKATKEPIYDELTCQSCSKTFSNPVLLPCDHCICETCIPRQKEVTKKGANKYAVVTCPECQEQHYFTSSEKVKFPNNFLLNEVLNRVESQNKKGSKRSLGKPQPNCQLCDKKNKQAAVKKCENCDLNFCKDCLKQHDKTYVNHSFTQPSAADEQANCFDHPDTTLTMFCLHDKIPICEECTKEKHKGHGTSSIPDAFKDQSIHLLYSIAKYGKVKDESENDMLRLNIFKTKLKENKDKFHKQVNTEFESLHNQLKTKEKEVKAIHESELNMKLSNINTFLEDTAKQMASTEGLVQYAKEAAKETDEFVLLQTINHLNEKLKEKTDAVHLSDRELMTTPVDVNAFDFGRISQQINQIFQPITDKYELVKSSKVSTIIKRKVSDHVVVQPERVESKTSEIKPGVKTPEVMESEEIVASPIISQENIIEAQPVLEESIESLRNVSDLEVEDKKKKPSILDTKMDTPVPPTIYHHIVNGMAAKIFWMVPEYDMVDSFDVHLQEVGVNKGIMTPQNIGVVFSGINASSFETTLKDNSEVIFKVRAVNGYGASGWSYPYRIILK